jgi:serine/threonine protein kinase
MAGIAAPAGLPSDAPTFFGAYTIQHVIAEGGLGAVLRAVHIPTNRTVALKVPNPKTITNAAGQAAVSHSFTDEIAALIACEGTGVIPLYDAGIVGAVPYIAMRLIDGGAADRYLAGQDLLRQSRLTAIINQAIDGLCTIHDAGWIHRDIKLGNLLVSSIEHGTPFPQPINVVPPPTASRARWPMLLRNCSVAIHGRQKLTSMRLD